MSGGPRVAVYGAGAIGGYLAVRMAAGGAEVSLVARGPHLAAIKENGLTLESEAGRETVRLPASDNPADLGEQDYVVLALKAHGVGAILEPLQSLLGPETAVVTAQNGIPWWYFQGHGGPLDGTVLESVDPGGRLSAALPASRCIGCVVYPSAEIVAPGVVKHGYGNRFMLGEPDGSRSERIKKLSRAMTAGDLKAPIRPKIRDDIWLKLWGNLSFNPVSALTGATLEVIAADPGTRRVVRAMMVEAEEVGRALGVEFSIDVDTRIGWAADVGAHKTSMLQDLELGRAMEIDALVTVIAEMARKLGRETPSLDTVLSLVQQRARLAGCYK